MEILSPSILVCWHQSLFEYVSSVTDLNGVTAAVVMLQIAIHEMLNSNLRQNTNIQP